MRFGSTIPALILVLPGFAQTTVPRLRDGHPDLNGFWNNANLTPFQRPAGLGGKQYFTKANPRRISTALTTRPGSIAALRSPRRGALHSSSTRPTGAFRR